MVINVIIYLVIIGLLMWAVNTYVPMADPYKKILNIVVLVLVIIWLLSLLGVLPRVRL